MGDATSRWNASVPDTPAPTAGQALVRSLQQDRVLRGVFAFCGLLIAYQLAVTLLQPPWIKPVTDWLRTALAWPQFLIVAWAGARLLRTRKPGGVAWCFAALGLLSYAVARTMWSIADVYIFPHGVPFPSAPDLFFILQYPLFFTALFLARPVTRLFRGLRTMVDGLLWMSAVSALSWYFILNHIAGEPGESQLAKTISMGYQLGDLVAFYGILIYLAQPRHIYRDQVIAVILCVAFACLFVADTWAAVLLFTPPHAYRSGRAPDVFWLVFYLLLPLAAVVRFRFVRERVIFRPEAPSERLSWRDLWAGTRFALPSLAVLAVSAVILINASMTLTSRSTLNLPDVVGLALLLLAAVRPAIIFLEQKQLIREREAARAQEAALQAMNERMEDFLATASHELKTPLTSLVGYVQLITQRIEVLLSQAGKPDEATPQEQGRARTHRLLQTAARQCERSIWRLNWLVDELLDASRIRQRRLALHLDPADLAMLVGAVVAEQRELHPERSIEWAAAQQPVTVVVDAYRIEQVVTNFLSNALKFSLEEQPVMVQLETEGEWARVSVRDHGVGVSEAEQTRIWERFYQAKDTRVQSGSQVGLGLGLYISKSIIEQHGGQVGAQSAPHAATIFWFALPLTHSRPSEEPFSPDRTADAQQW